MQDCVISGTGLWIPPDRITNAELVASLRAAAERWNLDHKDEIEAGRVEARDLPSERFILKVSEKLSPEPEAVSDLRKCLREAKTGRR